MATVLTSKDVLDFVVWTLSNVARRSPSKTKHQNRPFRSEHFLMQPQPGYLRGSDLSERLFVCVKALELSGYTNKHACVTVAECCGDLVGKSKRGRRSTDTRERDLLSKAQSIRTRVNVFGRRQEYTVGLVDYRIGQFLHLRRAGVVCGSKYVPDPGPEDA